MELLDVTYKVTILELVRYGAAKARVIARHRTLLNLASHDLIIAENNCNVCALSSR